MIRHQVKSKWYYIFWGSMAVAVVSGQIYVGLGYRKMAESADGKQIFVTCTSPYETPPLQKRNRTGEFE